MTPSVGALRLNSGRMCVGAEPSNSECKRINMNDRFDPSRWRHAAHMTALLTLIRLLIRKGVLTTEEVVDAYQRSADDFMRAQATEGARYAEFIANEVLKEAD